jgi:subtilisin family serine protease
MTVVAGDPGEDLREESDDILDLIGLRSVMALGLGHPDITVGILDGPVSGAHPDLADASMRTVGAHGPRAGGTNPAVSGHGTAVAGILAADRRGRGIGVCPGCALIVRPVFDPGSGENATASSLASGIVDCVRAGARLLNISAAYTGRVPLAEHELRQALDHAAARGVVVVVAAGNDGRVGGSPLTSHPWVIPVTSTDRTGAQLPAANIGGSIGRNGLRAPGQGIRSLTPGGGYDLFGGTSASAPLVTGALALAWSAALSVDATTVRGAVAGHVGRRRSVVPPLLDARVLYRAVADRDSKERV